MTNRDYLMGLSDRDLAGLLNGNRICDYVETCYDCDCTRCIAKWLETEIKPDVKKGQIRRSDSGRYYLVLYVKNSDDCLISTENGVVVRALTQNVRTWDVVEDADVDEFLERVFENL